MPSSFRFIRSKKIENIVDILVQAAVVMQHCNKLTASHLYSPHAPYVIITGSHWHCLAVSLAFVSTSLRLRLLL
jgi:hypothetical protein